MGDSRYNHFIKDYETIRSILKNIYIYGCYNKEQLIGLEKIKGKKYDNEIRRIKYFLNEANRVENRVNGKKVVSLKYDRYDNIANFLVKSYKIKTFSPQDINLYFYILQVMSAEAEAEAVTRATAATAVTTTAKLTSVAASEEALTVSEIITKIQMAIDHIDPIDDNIDGRMVRAKIEEIIDMGLLEIVNNKPLKVKLAKNIMESFEPNELSLIHQLLYFYRNTTPLAAAAYFTQETMKNYLQYCQGDDCISEDVFLFKHTFLHNILNDEIVYVIMDAFDSNQMIKFLYDDSIDGRDNKEAITEVIAVPLKLLFDQQYGRQLLYCYDKTLERPRSYRLDRISKIQIVENRYNPNRYVEYIKLIDRCWSMTQINYLDNPINAPSILVEIDFHIAQDKPFILTRLIAEKRHGNVEKVSQSHWLYSIEVLSPLEMIPWIRSYGEYACVRKSDKHDLAQRIREDWKGVLAEYGIF